MIIIVCGVSGAGKSTIGTLLARALGLAFYDGDDFHPAANITKMASGVPLADSDREPWLKILARQISGWGEQGGAVLACSALKESYRQALTSQWQGEITWVFLTGSEELLVKRIISRKGHFFSPSLLRSQLETLELPKYGLKIDIGSPPDDVVGVIREHLLKA